MVLLSILLLAPLFSYLPMAAMAALLLMVAWNMSEAPHVLHTLGIAPRNDVLVLLTCLTLTVLFDMVLAVGVGMLLAAGMFIKRMSDLTDTTALPRHFHQALANLPKQVMAYSIRGPLFFGAAEKALSVLRRLNPDVRVVMVEISAVPMLDMTALAAKEKIGPAALATSHQGIVFSPLHISALAAETPARRRTPAQRPAELRQQLAASPQQGTGMVAGASGLSTCAAII